MKSCVIPIFVNASRSILTIIIIIFIQNQITWVQFYKLFAPHADHLRPTLNFYSTKNFSKLGHRAQMVLCSAQTSLWNWPVLEPSLYHSCFLIVCWAWMLLKKSNKNNSCLFLRSPINVKCYFIDWLILGDIYWHFIEAF